LDRERERERKRKRKRRKERKREYITRSRKFIYYSERRAEFQGFQISGCKISIK